MARELVENKGIGESAPSIWRNLAEVQLPAASAVEVEPAAEVPPVMAVDVGAFDMTVAFEPVPVSGPSGGCSGALQEDQRCSTTVPVLSIGKGVQCVP